MNLLVYEGDILYEFDGILGLDGLFCLFGVFGFWLCLDKIWCGMNGNLFLFEFMLDDLEDFWDGGMR